MRMIRLGHITEGFYDTRPQRSGRCKCHGYHTKGSRLEQKSRVCRRLNRRKMLSKRSAIMARRFSRRERPLRKNHVIRRCSSLRAKHTKNLGSVRAHSVKPFEFGIPFWFGMPPIGSLDKRRNPMRISVKYRGKCSRNVVEVRLRVTVTHQRPHGIGVLAKRINRVCLIGDRRKMRNQRVQRTNEGVQLHRAV